MSHSDAPVRNSQDASHVADAGGSGIPLTTGDFRTYIVSRLITGIVLLFVLSVAVFVLTHVLPHDPSPGGQLALLRDELGLSSPLSQYLNWIGNTSRGDFGYSVNSGTAVGDLIVERLPATLSLLPLTMFFAAAVSLPLGILATTRRCSLMDRVVEGAAVFGVGVPSFWLALMLMLVLPMWSSVGPMDELVLPSLILAILVGAVMVRVIRSSIVEVVDREDIEPPRGRRLPVRACLVHCLGNVLFWAPALFGVFLAGAIVVETVLVAPGIGSLAVSAAQARDYPVLQAVAMVAAGMAVIVLGFSLVTASLVRRLEPGTAIRPAGGQPVSTRRSIPPVSSMYIARKVPRVPLIAVGILLVVAALAPIIATQDPVRVSIEDASSSPGAGHLLGTDALGRDVLSRLVYGARPGLAVALLSLIPVAVLGGGLGLLSGYAGGKVDASITGALDNIPAFPPLLLATLVMAVFDPGLTGLPIAVTLVLWPRVARATRDEVAVLKATGGFSLSNAINPIIALLTLHFGLSFLMEATLSFLGLGIEPPTPSWGGMMAVPMQQIRAAPWIAIFPGLALTALTVTLIASPFRWSRI